MTPDGWRAASASSDQTLRVWDLECGACLHTLEGHCSSIYGVRVMPDCRRAISVSLDKTLRLWDLESGACIRILAEHTGTVEPPCVTPDSRYAVSASWDRTLRVWELEYGMAVTVADFGVPLSAVDLHAHQVVLGTNIGQILIVDIRNLPSGPAIIADRSDTCYEATLRLGFDYSRHKKGEAYEETQAHRTALATLLEHMGQTDEARALIEERDRLAS